MEDIFQGFFANFPRFSQIFAGKILFLNLPRFEDKNVIISAHNGVSGAHLFPGDKGLEEGGFYVLSINNNKLVFEHEFHNFNLFSKQFFERNHNQ